MPTFLLPIGDDVIIHPLDRATKVGSIYLTDKTRLEKRTNQGIIIAKGPLVSNDLDTADHVFFNGYSGDKLAFKDHGEFFVIPESHVICKVQNSTVVLMDTETVRRVIQERFGEVHHRELESHSTEGKKVSYWLKRIERDLLDRIDTITIAEGWEF